MKRSAAFLMVGTVLTVAACGGGSDETENTPSTTFHSANAEIVDPNGDVLGSVEMSEDGNGTTLNVSVDRGLASGMHGVHLHEVGLCEGPDFKSAGGHWNPQAKEHGRDNPKGAHAGDLSNISIGDDGSGKSIYLVEALMSAGGMTMADADGTALVIHEGPDDYATDPSGDSGSRVACAVLAPAQ